jgi:hypothetical protein
VKKRADISEDKNIQTSKVFMIITCYHSDRNHDGHYSYDACDDAYTCHRGLFDNSGVQHILKEQKLITAQYLLF